MKRPVHFDFSTIEASLRAQMEKQRLEGLALAENDDDRRLIEAQTNENWVAMTVAFHRWLVDLRNQDVPQEAIMLAGINHVANTAVSLAANIDTDAPLSEVAAYLMYEIAQIVGLRALGRQPDGSTSSRLEIPGQTGGNA